MESEIKSLVSNLNKLVAPKPTKKAKRKKSRHKKMNNVVPAGQVNMPDAGGSGAKQRLKQYSGVTALPDYSVGWLERFLDPCGEYRTAQDYGKVPDGTLPQSATGQFRENFTIRYPGANPMVTPVDGAVWSLLGIHLNSWRKCFLFIADMERPEVSNEALTAVARDINSATTEIYYPQWVPCSTVEGLYWSLVRWSALDNVPPPSSAGVSPFIEQYRITGDGFTMYHNTPSLVNQGMVVTAQFNPNNEVRTVNFDSEGDATIVSVSLTRNPSTVGSNSLLEYSLPGLGLYPWRGSVMLVVPAVGNTTNSSVLSGNVTGSLTVGGVVQYTVGDSLRFSMTNVDGSVYVSLQVQPGSTGAFTDVNIGLPLGAIGNYQFNNIAAGLAVEENHARLINALALPPITQEDLVQQTAKAVTFLLKETGGVTVSKRIWQPVFNMTKASNYAEMRLLTDQITISELNSNLGVYQDTFDLNIGTAVINLTSLPLACAPFFKCVRSWEVIPSRGSPWGPFTTSCSPKDDMAMVIAKTISDEDPFAYPAEYNGFGLLFAKVISVVKRIPRYLRTATNVADAVSNCVTEVQAGIANSESRDRSMRNQGRARALM